MKTKTFNAKSQKSNTAAAALDPSISEEKIRRPLTALAEGQEDPFTMDMDSAIRAYEDRDALRCETWRRQFG